MRSNQAIDYRLLQYRQRQEPQEPIQIGLVLDEKIFPLAALASLHSAAHSLLEASTASELTPGIQGLLADWERSRQALADLTAFVRQQEVDEPALWRNLQGVLEAMHVLPPVVHPTKMLFAGANYERHVREVENWKEAADPSVKEFTVDKTTTRPYVFLKLPYCLIGPYDPVVHPASFQKLDWEGELALIIGKRGKHIPVERAMDYVAGFTIANDYSLRSMNMRADWPGLRSDWFGGKNFDTSACLGPYLVPREFVPNYLNLSRRLKVNGSVKQDASTQGMIFTPAEIIVFVSSIVTLEPGDVIATGSPPGAGFATGEYLKPGDIVEAEIEGLGYQRNLIITEEGAKE